VAWRQLAAESLPQLPPEWQPDEGNDTLKERFRKHLESITDVSAWIPQMTPVGSRIVLCIQV
jgi:hypothetical protein